MSSLWVWPAAAPPCERGRRTGTVDANVLVRPVIEHLRLRVGCFDHDRIIVSRVVPHPGRRRRRGATVRRSGMCSLKPLPWVSGTRGCTTVCAHSRCSSATRASHEFDTSSMGKCSSLVFMQPVRGREWHALMATEHNRQMCPRNNARCSMCPHVRLVDDANGLAISSTAKALA